MDYFDGESCPQTLKLHCSLPFGLLIRPYVRLIDYVGEFDKLFRTAPQDAVIWANDQNDLTASMA